MYQASVLKTPSEKYIIVGTAHMSLLYTMADGQPVTDVDYVTSQMRLPSKYRSIKSRTFDTLEAAQAALDEVSKRYDGTER